jgi:hypothetical protein
MNGWMNTLCMYEFYSPARAAGHASATVSTVQCVPGRAAGHASAPLIRQIARRDVPAW